MTGVIKEDTRSLDNVSWALGFRVHLLNPRTLGPETLAVQA